MAGGFATLRRILAGVPCTAINYVYPCEFDNLTLSSHKNYNFHESDCRERPLWSQLPPQQQAQLAAKIQTGYERLIERSVRRPGDLGGLVGQGWIHHMACDVGLIHGNSAFLPWHRAFLYFHERWLQHVLGDRTFRLPVWDWEQDNRVPPIYDGWLHIPGPGAVQCDYLASTKVRPIDQPTLQSWLLSHCFIDFAGGKGFTTSNAMGSVHSNVHAELGGLMADPQASALHPVFYSHHSNVDRYWCKWWQSYGNFDGFLPEFPDKPWYFCDPQHGIVRVFAEQLMNTEPLGYKYNLPVASFYHVTNICAAIRDDFISLNPSAFLGLLGRLANETQNSIARTEVRSQGFTTDPTFTVIALTSAVLALFGALSLPVRMSLRIPGIQAGSYYPLRLSTKEHSVVIGGVSVFGRHRHGEELTACASLSLADLSLMWRSVNSIQVSLDPVADGSSIREVQVLDFTILHPRLDQYTDNQLNAFLGISRRAPQ